MVGTVFPAVSETRASLRPTSSCKRVLSDGVKGQLSDCSLTSPDSHPRAVHQWRNLSTLPISRERSRSYEVKHSEEPSPSGPDRPDHGERRRVYPR